jgi:hypothetical protein
MLTHTQQVRRALKELAPAGNERAQCAAAIEDALEEIEFDALVLVAQKKETRRLVAQLYGALRKCQSLHKALMRLDAKCGGIVAPLDLSEEIACYEEWLAEPTERSGDRALRQKSAVKHARALVVKYRPRKQDYTLTRRNAWHRLSAILAGDKKLDLFNHMRASERT